MKFGLSVPFRGPLANASDIRDIAQAAERFGYDIIAVSDHLVVPARVEANYPYSESGEFAWTADGSADCMEQFTLLAWLAAITNKVRLLTSVAVIPHRNPIFMAKSIATTDQLSGGRVNLGVGAGWMREEFEALNLPDFDARGRVTNEYIEIMRLLWREKVATFKGEFMSFADVQADPKPAQAGGPPVWVGGESLPALRRTVALGDTWYPFGSNPRFRMDTIEAYVKRRDRLFGLAEEAGRDPGDIELTYNCAFHNEAAQPFPGDRPGRLTFTGTPEERAGDIQALGQTGVTTMMVNVTAGDRNAMLDRMQAFSEDVMPLI
jgi:probable F420-dependent oxidoreductase